MRYITVEDLSFYYDKEPVLEHINYSVDSGEFVTLTGENGAAKTTLIKASLGILQPRIGKVTISKTNTQGKKLRIAYLPSRLPVLMLVFQVRFMNLSSRVAIREKDGSVV